MTDSFIAVSKEPRWMRLLGVVLLLPGLIALIPFKADYLQVCHQDDILIKSHVPLPKVFFEF